VPSPVREPGRPTWSSSARTEDIYAGSIRAQSEKAHKLIKILQEDFGVKKIATSLRHRHQARIEGRHQRLVRKAIRYAIDNDKPSVTLVHKGSIMKVHRRRLPRLGLCPAQKNSVPAVDGGPWCKFRQTGKVVVKDTIADASCGNPAAPGRILGDRHTKPERRLHFRHPGCPGRRHRHRSGPT
jgi:isocitrate dehydrogenase